MSDAISIPLWLAIPVGVLIVILFVYWLSRRRK